ncbi:hypothetical protein ACM7JK_07510 [Pseudomonas aeruginosa]
MDLNNLKLHGIEKAMEARWALIFIASLTFIDAYMILAHDLNVGSISLSWAKNNIDLSEAATIIGLFTITFGLLIPGIGLVGKLIFGTLIDITIYKLTRKSYTLGDWRRPQEELDKSHYVRANELRTWAIKNSNSAAYRDYENFMAERKEASFLRYICQTIIALSLLGYLFSTPDNPTLAEIIVLKIEATRWYYEWPLKWIWGGLTLFIIAIAFRDEGELAKYIRLTNHNIHSEYSNSYRPTNKFLDDLDSARDQSQYR